MRLQRDCAICRLARRFNGQDPQRRWKLGPFPPRVTLKRNGLDCPGFGLDQSLTDDGQISATSAELSTCSAHAFVHLSPTFLRV